MLCEVLRFEEMQETVENLWEEDFYVIGEDVPDEPGKEFVTPTIVPLRADALGNIDKPTVVIQYKTYPMSEGANPNEADNLATGNQNPPPRAADRSRNRRLDLFGPLER